MHRPEIEGGLFPHLAKSYWARTSLSSRSRSGWLDVAVPNLVDLGFLRAHRGGRARLLRGPQLAAASTAVAQPAWLPAGQRRSDARRAPAAQPVDRGRAGATPVRERSPDRLPARTGHLSADGRRTAHAPARNVDRRRPERARRGLSPGRARAGLWRGSVAEPLDRVSSECRSQAVKPAESSPARHRDRCAARRPAARPRPAASRARAPRARAHGARLEVAHDLEVRLAAGQQRPLVLRDRLVVFPAHVVRIAEVRAARSARRPRAGTIRAPRRSGPASRAPCRGCSSAARRRADPRAAPRAAAARRARAGPSAGRRRRGCSGSASRAGAARARSPDARRPPRAGRPDRATRRARPVPSATSERARPRARGGAGRRRARRPRAARARVRCGPFIEFGLALERALEQRLRALGILAQVHVADPLARRAAFGSSRRPPRSPRARTPRFRPRGWRRRARAAPPGLGALGALALLRVFGQLLLRRLRALLLLEPAQLRAHRVAPARPSVDSRVRQRDESASAARPRSERNHWPGGTPASRHLLALRKYCDIWRKPGPRR